MASQGKEVAEEIELWVDIVTMRPEKNSNTNFFSKVEEQ